VNEAVNDTAPWLERELARQLAPVIAPASLWSRIEEPLRFRRTNSLRWIAWPAVALATLILCAGLLRRIDQARNFDFQSRDFGAIRSWVKTQADIDIDLPEGTLTENAPIRLSGVRLIRVNGLRVAAIEYRIGNNAATLFVSGKRSVQAGNAAAPKHLFSEVESAGKARRVSWNMGSQSYTIAFSGAGDTHAACLLCHANVPGLIMLN